MGQVAYRLSDPFDSAAPDPEVASAACGVDRRLHGKSLIVVELHCPMRMMARHQVERDNLAAAARAGESQPLWPFGRPHKHQPVPADRPAWVRTLIDELNAGEAVAAADSSPPCPKLRPESVKCHDHRRTRHEVARILATCLPAIARAGRRRYDSPGRGGMRYGRQSASCSARSDQAAYPAQAAEDAVRSGTPSSFAPFDDPRRTRIAKCEVQSEENEPRTCFIGLTTRSGYETQQNQDRQWAISSQVDEVNAP